MMVKELLLEAPAWLEATEPGQIAGAVRLANHNISEWRCSCRFEGGSGFEKTLVFAADGTARLTLPSQTSGTLSAVLELAEPYGGARLIGAFSLTLEAVEGRRGAVYQTLGPRGAAAPSSAVVDDKVMLRIPLLAERPGRAVPLGGLLDRERCVPLPDRGDGSARVVAVHAGESTVLGRCYASQLRASVRGFLQDLGESTIHWVTLWDDRWVNKLSTCLRYRLENGHQSLEIRNVTDYSQARNELRILSSQRDELRVKPGEVIEFPLDPGDVLAVVVGEGEHQRELVRCRFVEMRLGKLGVRVPVFKTEGTRFRFPPDDQQGLEMRYLGIWLPLDPERVEHLLTLAEEPLAIAFPQDAVYFWLRYRHARGTLTMSSNEDLREGLKR